MNIDDLKAFVWVAEAGGFSRASAEQRVAQSALSRRVARLESELGIRLVKRDGRGVRLTDQGNLLLERSGGIFAEIDAVKRQMVEHSDEPRGEVTLAMPPTTAQVLAPLIAMEVTERFPEVHLRMLEGFSGAIHNLVVSGRVDLALLYEPEERSDISITPLINEPVYLIVAKDRRSAFPVLNERKVVRFSDLPKLPLILPSKSHSIRSLIERQAIERRLKLNLAFEVDGIRATKAMVQAGLGCTMFSYAAVYEDVNAGRLEVIETMPRLSWTLSLGEPKREDSGRAVQAVRGVILEKLQALKDGGYWRGRFLFR
ncbi:LysR family transcriptional regulator [Antarcticimicrobium luteum]|uniref:LysR family transcriptional regulator n=1 Tax=Antarcticimicrobium luteum TaxID=2547397 RepID=UPI001408B24B|nr:LysR family transcriptional regulator [Antarcticimicrobium luteum]